MVDRVKEVAGDIFQLAQQPSEDNRLKANRLILDLLREHAAEVVPVTERLVIELRQHLVFMRPQARQFLEPIVAFLEQQVEGIEERA